MKYFETKHERDSAKITALITVILLLLLFVVGPPYMDPPIEYGVAVNFGNSNVGSGKIQPKKPVKSEPKKVEEQPKVEESQPESAKPKEIKEEVITQDTEESIAIKKQKAAEAKALAEAKAETERIAREKRIQEEKKRNLDALIGGVSKSDGDTTGSEGNDNKAGDKGQLNGDPYAPSYFGEPGTGGGGSGYGLRGRGRPSREIVRQDCNEEGRVVVKITVNRSCLLYTSDAADDDTIV